jgi:hypothetical protein
MRARTLFDSYESLTRWCLLLVAPPISGIAVLAAVFLFTVPFLFTGLPFTGWIEDSWSIDANSLYFIFWSLVLFHCVAIIPCGIYQIRRNAVPCMPTKWLFVFAAIGILALSSLMRSSSEPFVSSWVVPIPLTGLPISAMILVSRSMISKFSVQDGAFQTLNLKR